MSTTQRTNLIKRGTTILGANGVNKEKDSKKSNTSLILNSSLNTSSNNPNFPGSTKGTLQSKLEIGKIKYKSKENNENDKNAINQNFNLKRKMTIDVENNNTKKNLNSSYNLLNEKEKDKEQIKVSVKLQEIPENNQDCEMHIGKEDEEDLNNIEMKISENNLNENNDEEKFNKNHRASLPNPQENNYIVKSLAHGEIKKRSNLNNVQNEEFKEKKEVKIKVNEPNSTRNNDLNTQNNKFNFKSLINEISIKDKSSSSTNIGNSLNAENMLINKQNEPKFTNDEYRRMFSRILKREMGKSHLQNLFEEEEEIGEFLEQHKITERMRTRMIDWMIEVLTNYKCDDNSFFLAVNTMDRYFKAMEQMQLQPAELHLIGVTAMFMASKFEDIYPLRLRIVHEKIAHKKLSTNEIKNKETDICEKLEFILGKPTQWEFINNFIEDIFYTKVNNFQVNDKMLKENYGKLMDSAKNKVELNQEFSEYETEIFKNYTPNMINLLRHVVVYLAKMNYHDYSLSIKKPSLIAASTIFVAMKICEQINKEEYVNEYFSKKLTEISQKNENDIIKTAQKILHNAQNFDTIFNGLENLKKIHFNAIIDLKNTK